MLSNEDLWHSVWNRSFHHRFRLGVRFNRRLTRFCGKCLQCWGNRLASWRSIIVFIEEGVPRFGLFTSLKLDYVVLDVSFWSLFVTYKHDWRFTYWALKELYLFLRRYLVMRHFLRRLFLLFSSYHLCSLQFAILANSNKIQHLGGIMD